MDAMKRTLISVAAAFAVASTSAVAQGVKMSDEQLDQITAAGALSAVVISNPGKANVAHNLELQRGHGTCINCTEFVPTPNEGRTGGVVVVINRKFTDANPLIRCVGGGLQGFC
jgi:hypothetical protein